MSIRGSRSVSLALLAMVAVAIAGCGTPAAGSASPTASEAAPSLSPTATPEPSASDVATPAASPDESPSAEASFAAGTLCTTGGTAAAGAELATTDPNVSARLPAGWDPVAIDDYADKLQQALGPIDDPRVQKALAWQLGLIDEGVMRIASSGVSEPSGFNAALLMSVLPPTGDLQTTVDFRLNDQATNGIPQTVVDVIATELSAGPAYCTAVTSDIELGTPSQTIEYVVLMPSGDIVAIGGTAPTTDTDFPALVRTVALSLTAD